MWSSSRGYADVGALKSGLCIEKTRLLCKQPCLRWIWKIAVTRVHPGKVVPPFTKTSDGAEGRCVICIPEHVNGKLDYEELWLARRENGRQNEIEHQRATVTTVTDKENESESKSDRERERGGGVARERTETGTGRKRERDTQKRRRKA